MQNAYLDAIVLFTVEAVRFAAYMIADTHSCHQIAFVGGINKDFAFVGVATDIWDGCGSPPCRIWCSCFIRIIVTTISRFIATGKMMCDTGQIDHSPSFHVFFIGGGRSAILIVKEILCLEQTREHQSRQEIMPHKIGLET